MRGKGTKIYFMFGWDGVAPVAYTDEHCYLTEVKPPGVTRDTSPVVQCLSEESGGNDTGEAVWGNLTGVVKQKRSSGGTLIQDKMEAALLADDRVPWALEYPHPDGTFYQEGIGKFASFDPQNVTKNEDQLVDIEMAVEAKPQISDSINLAP